MASIDLVAGDHARKRRSVPEELQLARGLSVMADGILSDLQATTHELQLCATLAAASQAHAALASAYMLEAQARQWELQTHLTQTVEIGGPGTDEPLAFRPGIDGVAPPDKPAPVHDDADQPPAPTLAAPRKAAPVKASAKSGGRARR